MSKGSQGKEIGIERDEAKVDEQVTIGKEQNESGEGRVREMKINR